MRLAGSILLALLLTLAGCSGSEEPVLVPDREVFDKAVARYLRIKSMDLAVGDYESFELTDGGESATAVVALTHADEVYGNVRVRYRFDFEKAGDRWEVVSARKGS